MLDGWVFAPFLLFPMVDVRCLVSGFNRFLRLLPSAKQSAPGELERILCNRLNKPQGLNMKAVPLLSLRGPNVLFLASLAYSDGSTHINERYKK
jgi:hypothetical protein